MKWLLVIHLFRIGTHEHLIIRTEIRFDSQAACAAIAETMKTEDPRRWIAVGNCEGTP